MQKPNKELQDDFKKIGITILDKIKDIPSDSNYLSLHVEIGFPEGTDIGSPDFDVMFQNKRGTKTYFSDFRTVIRESQLIFMFETYQEVPNNIPIYNNLTDIHFCSFSELCLPLGNNAIDSSLAPSVQTIKKDNAKHVDLGWLLPSRFVDTVAEALGMLNNTILSGTLVEALVYGPFVRFKNEEK